MKVKESLVKQIIKEEAMKVKKLIALKEEKQQILKQLNELYEGEDMEEGIIKRAFGLQLKDNAAALNHINQPENVGKKEIYEKLGSPEFKQKFPNAQADFLEFVKDHPQLYPNEMRFDQATGKVMQKTANDVNYKPTTAVDGDPYQGKGIYGYGGMAGHLGGGPSKEQ